MNWKLMTSIAVITTSTLVGMPFGKAQTNEKLQFICQESFDASSNRRLPTTFAWTSRGKIAVIRWETQAFRNWNPQKRCEDVSPRFQKAYDNGSINIITNGTINNQPVICTARDSGKPCDTLLITLRPEDNSLDVLNHLKAIFNGQQVGPVKHSSGTSQIYYRIDINKFLKSAPVEGN